MGGVAWQPECRGATSLFPPRGLWLMAGPASGTPTPGLGQPLPRPPVLSSVRPAWPPFPASPPPWSRSSLPAALRFLPVARLCVS